VRLPVTMTSTPVIGSVPGGDGIDIAATRPVETVLRDLGATEAGLTAEEVARRRARWGPNAVATHYARFLPVLGHQLRLPLLGLLLVAIAS
jgi:Mg2+-importing ATPase